MACAPTPYFVEMLRPASTKEPKTTRAISGVDWRHDMNARTIDKASVCVMRSASCTGS